MRRRLERARRKVLQFRLSEALYESLREAAQRNGRSMSQEVLARLDHDIITVIIDQEVKF